MSLVNAGYGPDTAKCAVPLPVETGLTPASPQLHWFKPSDCQLTAKCTLTANTDVTMTETL